MGLTPSSKGILGDAHLLARVLEQSQTGIALHDGDGRAIAHNSRAELLLGARPDGLDSYRFHTVNGDEVPLERSPLGRVLAGALTERADLVVKRAGGPPRRVRVSAERLDGAASDGADGSNGRPRGLLVTLVDLTEIEAAEALQKEVFGVVGHDLRNPLSAIRMTAQLLARPTPMPDERRKELAERVLSASKRMDNLVGALLDYARAKGGASVALAREAVDLEALCRKLVGDQEQNPVAAGRTFSVESLGPTTGTWDPSRLTQVVTNLLTNAILHGETNTPVTVRVDGSDPAVVRLSVHNIGPSIPSDLHGLVFEPFKTGKTTTRRGMGLGLFIVKQMVEAHSGVVRLHSGDVEGTTFTVELPRTLAR